MFKKILIANRGEIACRVIQTCQRMGIATVAVYSDADARAPFVKMADEAVHIGPAPASESYLLADKIIEACKQTGAEAVHPGYGFLSERASFVEALDKEGIVFIGPPAKAIAAMGDKIESKKIAREAGVNVVPGFVGEIRDTDHAVEISNDIGYPVMMKASAGGGGKGMRLAYSEKDVREGFEATKREGLNSFGDDRVFIEKFIEDPRHIEIQILGDTHGNVIYLNERECSIQRRHQKVVEEAPSPFVTPKMRKAMGEQCVALSKAVGYHSAGTVELIVSGADKTGESFYFLEMNTRLQVEHPVTEAITGQDLVEWQLRVAAGGALPLSQEQLSISGHAFEARLYAEDPANGFLPATGKLHHLAFSEAARNDAGVRSGDAITPFYDPMIAKVITQGETRQEALGRLATALRQTHVAGTVTNAAFLAALAEHEGFANGDVDTGLIDREIGSLIESATLPETAIALAAVIVLGIDPAARLAGWRLWGPASQKVRFVHEGEVLDRQFVLPGDGSVLLEGGAVPVRMRDIVRDGARVSARIGAGGERVTADIAAWSGVEGTAVSVLSEGAAHQLLLPDPLAVAAHHGEHGDAILAPMTGIVRAVTARAGAAVDKGEKLIVLEAMKMETSLTAPRAGLVAEIFCAEGETVEGGAILIRFEEAGE